MKIAYEPHPVSLERKAELRAQGCKIVDARFKPKSLKDDVEAAANSIPEKPRKAARATKRSPTKRSNVHGGQIDGEN